ncbi:dipeptide/oligopeptide/nickel ABC transporter ATP-binding protein [Thalassococcus sp. S3]|uniref:ATP-binding cassette domain-containing protein n=1 Tax=Thalassococcus sp. S3 TaxID=2017482 RepID=UPI0010247D69|nr:dipeptide/oligopeptide/nickel ABC transporter ATP-binding protein [Thalassococcus sp. S3]QBF32012.1 peptide ABC transporter ATP-binding protein [Thalassococcus sp. S3]
MSAALEFSAVTRAYRLPRRKLLEPAPVLTAADAVSLKLEAGATLGLIGESGSGKSTLARLAVGLERPDAGQVLIAGQDIWTLSPAERRKARAGFQMVFQDPMGSLDPRRAVDVSVAEPLIATGLSRADRLDRARGTLAQVGLPDAAGRFPHEFSGGQRQRIAIARAIVTEPALIIADEPVSALDTSVQAQILNLLMEVQDRTGAAMLFISHDMAVVSSICDEVAVMARGSLIRRGPVGEVLSGPAEDILAGRS